MELTLEATIESIAQVTEFVNAQLDAVGCSVKVQRLINIAIDELFGNIASYAYGSQTGMVTVRVDVQQDQRLATIVFIDAGIPFDPLKQEDPLPGLTVKERKKGGFGISIVKKSMDSVCYEYVNGHNVMTITKTY